MNHTFIPLQTSDIKSLKKMSLRCVCLLGLGLSLVWGQDLGNSTGSLSLPNARDCANR